MSQCEQHNEGNSSHSEVLHRMNHEKFFRNKIGAIDNETTALENLHCGAPNGDHVDGH